MQSITTKYLGPTDSHGGRIRASASGGGGSVTVAYDHGLDTEENHARACAKLMDKLKWSGEMVAGSTKGGYTFVFTTGTKVRAKR